MIVTCRDLTELVTDRKEGKLSAWKRAGCALHLAWCTRCRNYIAQLDLTVEALKRIPREEVPDAMRAALRERLRARSRD